MARSADVVVVGGGVVGCACAAALADRGVGVLLVERARLAAGASGRNHGLVLSPSEPALVPMARETLDVYRRTSREAEVPFTIDPEPIGYLVVARDDREAEQARGEAGAAEACGIAVRDVDGPALRALEPALAEELTGGWLLEDGLRLDPAALTVALAVRARRSGAEVRPHLAAQALDVRDGVVHGVVTDEGRIAAGTVVVAAGPWSPGLLRPAGVRLPVVGARGWLVHLAPRRPVLSRIVERAGWHLLPGEDAVEPLLARDVAEGTPKPEVGTLLHPGTDGTVLAGGSRQLPTVHEPEDHEVPREIARRAIELVPALASAEVLGAWWGIRPMSPDGRPLIGPVAEGVSVATGHGSQGVILAGGTAALVAAQVTGEPPPFDPEPFRPDRFG
ncbi:MAG TPA: FAD-dependent oxidoreductase [Actinomycetota bacterium]|nr:FAD-dependent oxidoreductase [Actinomycetota bacterium]